MDPNVKRFLSFHQVQKVGVDPREGAASSCSLNPKVFKEGYSDS